MAIERPVKVPQQKVASLDIVSFDGGLDQRGQANIRPNSFTRGRNVLVNEQGLATHRYGLKRWLPQTVGTVYEVFPALWEGQLYYFVADDGKIKWCQEGDATWTDCAMDGSAKPITTNGVVNTFLRVDDSLFILNGEDEQQYVELDTRTVKGYIPLDDPDTQPNFSLEGLSSGTQKIYYGITYNSTVGETALSPIRTISVDKIRDQWSGDGSDKIIITDPNTRPAGAQSWNLYIALAMPGGIVQPADMLPLMRGIDITVDTFTDDGSLAIGLSDGTGPVVNGTAGPKAKYGVEIEGRAFLYGIKDRPYDLMIGGNPGHEKDFSPTHGGYTLTLNAGTNYYPMSVVGFRNGQGMPAITVMFSNTQGLSKQSIVEQQTITVGDTSFVVWGAAEQNYGAAGVSSPYGVVTYKGGLYFPSTDGIMRGNTQASLQNVLSFERISDPVLNEVNTIKTDKLENIVGTAWNNRVYWTIPARGFSHNNEILVYDVSRRDGECWYLYEIESQWLGVVSPQDSSSFVYVCQGNQIYRLQQVYVAQDETPDGLTKAFPVELTTALIGSNTAHDGFFAVVQVVFYLLNFLGTVDLTVTYRDYQSGRMISRTKTITNGSYAKSSVGNWSSPGYLFNQHMPTKVLTWGDTDVITDAESAQKGDIRVHFPLDNVVTNEMQATISVNLDNSSIIARSISFQGLNLGISPDIR